MDQTKDAEAARYRVWIAGYDARQGTGRTGGPPAAVALEPAEEGTMSTEQAAVYVEAFNRSASAGRREIWAVAVPVKVEYRGEPCPGQILDAHKKSPLLVCQVSTRNGLPPREYT